VLKIPSAGQDKLNHTNCSTNPADGSVLPAKPPKSNAAAQVLLSVVTYISWLQFVKSYFFAILQALFPLFLVLSEAS
jgi:hypothetical protein